MADYGNVPEAIVTSHTRRNGFSCPWHPLQLAAWFSILLITTFHYGFMVFYIPGNWRVFGYVIPGLLFLVHVVTTIVTSSIDPAERNVRLKTQSEKRLRPRFDRSKHEHVIENYYCNLCCVAVTEKAKHCRQCDKCVTNFDHHCKWLNNCVGSRNYRWFLASIISALTGTVLALVISVSLFILYFAGRESLRYNCHLADVMACNKTLKVFGASIPDPVFPTLTAALGVLSLTGVLLIGHLTMFHFYLIWKGLTTYDYIQLRPVREVQSHDRHCCAHLPKVNRVTPVDQCSNSSAGMANFDRTPSPSNLEANEDRGVVPIQTGSDAVPSPPVKPGRGGEDGSTSAPLRPLVQEGQMVAMRTAVSSERHSPPGQFSVSTTAQVAMGTGSENKNSTMNETEFTTVPNLNPTHSDRASLTSDEAHLTSDDNYVRADVTLLAPPTASSSPSHPEQ